MQDVVQIRKMAVIISNKRFEEFRCLGQSFRTDVDISGITCTTPPGARTNTAEAEVHQLVVNTETLTE